MLTALMVTAVLSCKPYHPAAAPETTLACEGADQVRRDVNGVQLERWSFAPQCMRTACEGFDFVRRDSRGFELERWSQASRCLPRPVRLTREPAPVRFGLTSRG